MRVCGTAWALSFSCAWLIVVVPFCGSSFPLVGRASGLPRGVEDAGLLVNAPAPDVVRLMPPLVFTDEEADTFLR
ncbi:hypothetical protein ADL27_25390, partial [Streptomyces sp. NRRL F-6602]